jgi:hypothetical protein
MHSANTIIKGDHSFAHAPPVKLVMSGVCEALPTVAKLVPGKLGRFVPDSGAPEADPTPVLCPNVTPLLSWGVTRAVAVLVERGDRTAHEDPVQSAGVCAVALFDWLLPEVPGVAGAVGVGNSVEVSFCAEIDMRDEVA